ncbi:hypothetical protein CC2G_014536 [Coprinopsis cinerea AmutBmut pab1-1]|nr:hypothetical protein CC2G_014536 [Coprinopsis cinerea AmutBmut pab1-1]
MITIPAELYNRPSFDVDIDIYDSRDESEEQVASSSSSQKRKKEHRRYYVSPYDLSPTASFIDVPLSPVMEEQRSFPVSAPPSIIVPPPPRRLRKRSMLPPPSPARSDFTHTSTINPERDFRSGWTKSMMSVDTFDYLNDKDIPHWRRAIRRHFRRFRALLNSGPGEHHPSWNSGRHPGVWVR